MVPLLHRLFLDPNPVYHILLFFFNLYLGAVHGQRATLLHDMSLTCACCAVLHCRHGGETGAALPAELLRLPRLRALRMRSAHPHQGVPWPEVAQHEVSPLERLWLVQVHLVLHNFYHYVFIVNMIVVDVRPFIP